MIFSSAERRSPPDRRGVERRRLLVLVPTDRRAGADRRGRGERRSNLERHRDETPQEHIRNALQLLANVAASTALDDELQRDLDSAIFRLRFAVERLEAGGRPPES